MNILLNFAPMGMGDVLAAEPTIGALVDKYGPDTTVYVAGDPKHVHDHHPNVSYDEPVVVNLHIGFPGVASIGLEEYSKLEALPIVDQSAKIAGVKLSRRTPTLYINNDERRAMYEYMKNKKGIDMSKPLVVISTDDNQDYRRNWGADNYAVLCDMIRAKYDVIILDAGQGPPPPPIADYHLYGLTMRETVAAMTHCNIFMGSNRGISQLAQMADLPAIIIFSLVPPERTNYGGKTVYPVYNDEFDCLFCMWRDMQKVVQEGKGCWHAGEQRNCMNTITPQMMFDKFGEAWPLHERKAE